MLFFQTIHYLPSKEESDLLILYGPLRELGNVAVAYEANPDGSGGRTQTIRRLELSPGQPAVVPQVQHLELSEGGDREIVFPRHLLAEELDPEDVRLLVLFLHLQPLLYNQFTDSHRSFVKNLLVFHDPFRTSGKAEVEVDRDFLEATSAAPECQRYARLRVLPRGSVHGTVLTGFPGSGNQWFARLLHLLSGFATDRRQG